MNPESTVRLIFCSLIKDCFILQFRGGPRGGSRDRSFDGSYGPREPGPPGVSGPSPAPTLPGPAGPAGPAGPPPRQRQPAPQRLQVRRDKHVKWGCWFCVIFTMRVNNKTMRVDILSN